MTGATTSVLHDWVVDQVNAGIMAAMQATSHPIVQNNDCIHAEISSINQKLGVIMATIADLMAALQANEADEAKMIMLLQTLSASNAALTKQLADAIATGGDASALDAVVNQMKADQVAMDAAIQALAVPPGKPVIT